MLSLAPSATPVGHCDLVRIKCESNSVRHSVVLQCLARQLVIIIREVEFQADATAATDKQMQKRINNKCKNEEKTSNDGSTFLGNAFKTQFWGFREGHAGFKTGPRCKTI